MDSTIDNYHQTFTEMDVLTLYFKFFSSKWIKGEQSIKNGDKLILKGTVNEKIKFSQ